jgi:hypothetical protein
MPAWFEGLGSGQAPGAASTGEQADGALLKVSSMMCSKSALKVVSKVSMSAFFWEAEQQDGDAGEVVFTSCFCFGCGTSDCAEPDPKDKNGLRLGVYVCAIGCLCVGVLSREPIVADNPLSRSVGACGSDTRLEGKDGNECIPNSMGGVEKMMGGGGTNEAGVQFVPIFALAP